MRTTKIRLNLDAVELKLYNTDYTLITRVFMQVLRYFLTRQLLRYFNLKLKRNIEMVFTISFLICNDYVVQDLALVELGVDCSHVLHPAALRFRLLEWNATGRLTSRSNPDGNWTGYVRRMQRMDSNVM